MISFKFHDIAVRLYFSFFFLLSVFLLLEKLEQGGHFLFAVIWHELGHMLLLLQQKQQIIGMDCSAFGIRINRETIGTFWQEFLLYLAGPASNLLAALFLLPWNKVSAIFHLLLATLNLLPILPMDGGNLAALVLEQLLPQRAAQRSGHLLSVLTWLLILSLGAWLLLRYWNPAMLLFALLLAFQHTT